MIYNVLKVAFGAVRKITAPPIYYQYDAKQVLRFAGITLPDVYRVDFCNVGDSSTKPMVGTAEDGVEVPDEYLLTGKNIMAYLVVSSGDDDVETRYEITIPVTKRPTPTDVEPTPAQETTIDTLIDLLNAATDGAEAAAAAAEHSRQEAEEEADRAAQAASNAGWVYFYIDQEGHLHYVKTENADLDFYIDNNGNLHVTNGREVTNG